MPWGEISDFAIRVTLRWILRWQARLRVICPFLGGHTFISSRAKSLGISIIFSSRIINFRQVTCQKLILLWSRRISWLTVRFGLVGFAILIIDNSCILSTIRTSLSLSQIEAMNEPFALSLWRIQHSLWKFHSHGPQSENSSSFRLDARCLLLPVMSGWSDNHSRLHMLGSFYRP